MLEILRDTSGTIKAVCEYYIVNEDGGSSLWGVGGWGGVYTGGVGEVTAAKGRVGKLYGGGGGVYVPCNTGLNRAGNAGAKGLVIVQWNE